MDTVIAAASWLSVVFCAWAVATALAGAREDRRLAVSGGRGLHAAAALTLLALAMRLMEGRAAVEEAPFAVAAAILARTPWTDAGVRLLLWAAFAAAGSALVTRIVRRDPLALRARAQGIAGAIALLVCLGAAAAPSLLTAAAPEGEAAAPIAVHAWLGIVGRLLYLAGCALMIAPLALGGRGIHRRTLLRLALLALACLTASLALAAWVRYAVVAPAAELSSAGVPVSAQWSSLAALWGVVPLLVTAAVVLLAGAAAERRAVIRAPRGWIAALAVAVAATLTIAAVAPAIRDWTEGREVAVGFTVHPPLVIMLAVPVLLVVLSAVVAHARTRNGSSLRTGGAIAAGAVLLGGVALAAGTRNAATLLAIGVAGGAAAALAATYDRGAGVHGLARRVAACAALVTLGASLAAISVPPVQGELATGVPERVRLDGAPLTLTSQGASQEELPLYDAAVLLIEGRSGARAFLMTTGERIYRDAHGHRGARGAIPGVHRGALRDVRVVARGLRGDTALVQAESHPLALLAWLAAATTVVALLVAAGVAAPLAAPGAAAVTSATPAAARSGGR